jgi:hypothetical protein
MRGWRTTPKLTASATKRKVSAMTHHWDEFSKSLAEESLPRRESLRRLGIALAGAVLGPMGLHSTLAGHSKRQQDRCKSVCRCRNKWAQNQCLDACRACASNGTQTCGYCGNYYCTDRSDVVDCGACGNACNPGPSEYRACIDGRCEYACAEGAVYCDGTCSFLDRDFYNCGACGVVCEFGEVCSEGACVPVTCGGGYCPVVYHYLPPHWRPGCTDVGQDNYNCGACGNVCPQGGTYCDRGECVSYYYYDPLEGIGV